MDKKWAMLHLTRQERGVLLVILFLLLTGLVVKTIRTAYPGAVEGLIPRLRPIGEGALGSGNEAGAVGNPGQEK